MWHARVPVLTLILTRCLPQDVIQELVVASVPATQKRIVAASPLVHLDGARMQKERGCAPPPSRTTMPTCPCHWHGKAGTDLEPLQHLLMFPPLFRLLSLGPPLLYQTCLVAGVIYTQTLRACIVIRPSKLQSTTPSLCKNN
jgi:hypothetical protein